MLFYTQRLVSFLEFLRGDYVNLTMGLKSAQMTSLTVIIIGIIVFIYLQVKGSYDTHLYGGDGEGASRDASKLQPQKAQNKHKRK